MGIHMSSSSEIHHAIQYREMIRQFIENGVEFDNLIMVINQSVRSKGLIIEAPSERPFWKVIKIGDEAKEFVTASMAVQYALEQFSQS